MNMVLTPNLPGDIPEEEPAAEGEESEKSEKEDE